MVRDVRWCRDATMWCDVSRRITLIPVLVCSRVWHVACPREPGVRSRESANSFNNVNEEVSVKSYTLYLASASWSPTRSTWRPRARYPREQGARMPHATNTAIVLAASPQPGLSARLDRHSAWCRACPAPRRRLALQRARAAASPRQSGGLQSRRLPPPPPLRTPNRLPQCDAAQDTHPPARAVCPGLSATPRSHTLPPAPRSTTFPPSARGPIPPNSQTGPNIEKHKQPTVFPIFLISERC